VVFTIKKGGKGKAFLNLKKIDWRCTCTN